MAIPLYTAPADALATAISAREPGVAVGSLELQPAITPSSVAKRNRAGADVTPSVITKSSLSLNATPVGAPGISMVIGPGWPLASRIAASRSSLLETHHGPVGDAASPHPLTRFVSSSAPRWAK